MSKRMRQSMFSIRTMKSKRALIFSAILALKIALSAATPLSPDFTYTPLLIFTDSQAMAYAPWRYVERVLVDLWKVLPIDHPNIVGNWDRKPFSVHPSHYLLTIMLKLPTIFSDVALTFALHRAVLMLTKSRSKAWRAAMIWFANPYVIFAAHMWGSFDTPAILLYFLSVLFLATRRTVFSCLSIISAIALRLQAFLLAPLLAIYSFSESKSRINGVALLLSTLAGLLGYFSWLHISGIGIETSLLYLNPLTTSLDEFILAITTYHRRPLGLATVSIIAFYMLVIAIKRRFDTKSLFEMNLVVLGLLLAFTYWPPPYLLWIIPFVIVSSASENSYLMLKSIIFITLSWSVLSFAKTITADGGSLFFIPILTNEMEYTSRFLTALGQNPIVTVSLIPLLRSAISAVLLTYVGKLLLRHLRTSNRTPENSPANSTN